MTEIPEHLLKRSKERRAALGLPGGEGGDAASGSGDAPADSGSTAPATPAKAAPAPVKVEAAPPPPPKPDPPYIRAAKTRQRIPYWAMSVIAILPLWAFIYANGVSEPDHHDEATALGQEVYASCAGCHGANGAGGTGAQLSDGEALATFPDPVAMMEWILLGSDEWTGTSGSAPYGDPDREGGPHDTGTLSGVMPGFSDLSAEELAAVTRYIRETLAGEPAATPEVEELYEEWAEQAIEGAESGELVYRDIEPDEERIAAVSE